MKVGLIIPPSNSKDKPSVPLEALYIASVLKQEHHEVVVFDFSFNKDINRRMFKKGFHCFWIISNDNFHNALAVKAYLPKNIRTIISGTDPTNGAEDTSKFGWDFVLVGEPELAANGIVMGVFQPGILNCQTPENLDNLPFPSRCSVSISDYHGDLSEAVWMDIIGSRGEKSKEYNCVVRRPRQRSAHNIINEMEQLNNIYSVTKFHISNHMFTYNKWGFKNFLKEIKDTPFKFTLVSYPDPIMEDEIVDCFEGSGCEGITLKEEHHDFKPEKLKLMGIKINAWI